MVHSNYSVHNCNARILKIIISKFQDIFLLRKFYLSQRKILSTQYHREGEEPRNVPPPNRKNFCRKLDLFSEGVYIFEEHAELQEILKTPRNCEKVNFPRTLWSKNLKKSWKFSEASSFLVQPRKVLHEGICFPCQMEIIRQMLISFHFSTKFSRIFPPFPIVLYLSYF